MSDYFNNNDDFNTEEQNNSGTYSYKKEEINQGESFYQWSPYDDGNRVKKKKTSTLGKKLGNAAAIALVFGLVAGLAFQSIVAVTNRLWKLEDAKEPAIESTLEKDDTDKKVESTNTATGTTTGVKPYRDIGYTDSYSRVCDWIDRRIELMDDFLEYSESDAIVDEEALVHATVVERYNMNGQRVFMPQRGVNILRMSDGTVRKVLVK